jgi:hypothetical protein
MWQPQLAAPNLIKFEVGEAVAAIQHFVRHAWHGMPSSRYKELRDRKRSGHATRRW